MNSLSLIPTYLPEVYYPIRYDTIPIYLYPVPATRTHVTRFTYTDCANPNKTLKTAKFQLHGDSSTVIYIYRLRYTVTEYYQAHPHTQHSIQIK